MQKEEDKNTNENQNGDLPEEVQKLEYIENQNGDSLKKEEDENPNSAKRSLSFLLPSVDDQTPLVGNDQISIYLEPPKQEHTCAPHIGDDLSGVQETIGQNSNMEMKLDSYLLPLDDQTPFVDVQVLSNLESPKQDKQEHSCVHIGDDLPKIQESTGQDSNLETRPISYLFSMDDQTTLVDVLEPPKQEKQEHSRTHIGDDLPKIQEESGQNLNLDTKPRESQILVVEAQNQVEFYETETGSNSVSTRVTRSKRKAALQPDSIGGRLRQRRKSQSGL